MEPLVVASFGATQGGNGSVGKKASVIGLGPGMCAPMLILFVVGFEPVYGASQPTVSVAEYGTSGSVPTWREPRRGADVQQLEAVGRIRAAVLE
jgi:hypothetical protein